MSISWCTVFCCSAVAFLEEERKDRAGLLPENDNQCPLFPKRTSFSAYLNMTFSTQVNPTTANSVSLFWNKCCLWNTFWNVELPNYMPCFSTLTGDLLNIRPYLVWTIFFKQLIKSQNRLSFPSVCNLSMFALPHLEQHHKSPEDRD